MLVCLFIHLSVCLTTGPKPLPKRALHIVRSRASSFRCEYPLLSLRSYSSFLRLLPRLPVIYIPPFIFPSITCRRRQSLRNMSPIPCLLLSDIQHCCNFNQHMQTTVIRSTAVFFKTLNSYTFRTLLIHHKGEQLFCYIYICTIYLL
jgi:hypothetical protein